MKLVPIFPVLLCYLFFKSNFLQILFFFSLFLQNRTISHAKGSHGIAGIFVKYDLSALKIKVLERSRPLWRFLVRLCGIVGGVFVVSGALLDVEAKIWCIFHDFIDFIDLQGFLTPWLVFLLILCVANFVWRHRNRFLRHRKRRHYCNRHLQLFQHLFHLHQQLLQP